MAGRFSIGELLLGVSGVALLRHWGLDSDVVQDQVDTMARLLDRHREGAWAHVERAEKSVIAGYADWAAVYDDPGNPILSAEQPAVWELLKGYPRGQALDAACGTGRHAGYLAQLGHEVRGIDATPAMLERARAKVPGGRFEVAELESLPLDDGSVDLAVCGLALTHLAHLGPAISELARVVRPGGHVVISDVHPFNVGLGAHAAYSNDHGEHGVIRNYLHLASDYLSAFRDAGLEVTGCVEPLFGQKEIDMLPSASEEADLYRLALSGQPIVIVWETVRPPRTTAAARAAAARATTAAVGARARSHST